MNKSGQYIKDFAKQNPITTIVIGGVLFFVIRAQVKKIIDKAKPKPPRPTPVPIPPVPPPTPVPTPTPTPTPNTGYSYDSAQYNDWADQLQSAFDGPGTGWETCERIYRMMKNRMDILALHDAYGSRVITTPYGWDSNSMTLPQTLEYEFSPGNFTDLNAIIKKTGYQY